MIDNSDTEQIERLNGRVMELLRERDALVMALEETRAALDAMKLAVEASGKLNDRGYIPLGIQVNNALDKAGAILVAVGREREPNG